MDESSDEQPEATQPVRAVGAPESNRRRRGDAALGRQAPSTTGRELRGARPRSRHGMSYHAGRQLPAGRLQLAADLREAPATPPGGYGRGRSRTRHGRYQPGHEPVGDGAGRAPEARPEGTGRPRGRRSSSPAPAPAPGSPTSPGHNQGSRQPAWPPRRPGTLSRPRQIAAAVDPAVVDINTNLGEGTGMIATSNGEIITNNHVVEGASTIRVVDRPTAAPTRRPSSGPMPQPTWQSCN